MTQIDQRIKNLYYNAALFTLVSTINVAAITSITYSTITNDTKKYANVPKSMIDDKLRTLHLKDLDNKKEYSGMALSNEFEDQIKEIAQEYDIPYQIMLVIGDQESDGKWDNNGVISKTNDYGDFQINECNLKYLEENLGYTKEELLYDSYKNTEGCAYLVREIINRDDVDELEEIFGMYNGWTNWKNKSQALTYVSECNERMDTYFDDYQYVKTK